MALHGNTKIELTNVNSGSKIAIQKDNMITNAISMILNSGFMGAIYNGNVKYPAQFPIVPNAIGGLLLYSQKLTEDVTNVYAPSTGIVGYAGNKVNSGTDTHRGSLNVNESKAITNGYRFVWDFSTSQANGNICAAALTSADFGYNFYGSTDGLGAPMISLGVDGSTFTRNDTSDLNYLFYNTLAGFDTANNLIYLVLPNASNLSEIKIYVYKGNILNIGLFNPNGANYSYCQLISTHTVTATNFKNQGTYFTFGYYRGHIYGFNHAMNQSGNAVVDYIDINCTTWAVDQDRQITYTNENMAPAGEVSIGDGYILPRHFYSDFDGAGNFIITGYPAMYKISLTQPENYTRIENGKSSWVQCFNGVIFGERDGKWIDSSNTVHTGAGKTGLTTDWYYNYYFTNHKIFDGLQAYEFYCNSSGGGSSIRRYFLNECYLASINNFTTVTKTANQTMKVTYDLTES